MSRTRSSFFRVFSSKRFLYLTVLVLFVGLSGIIFSSTSQRAEETPKSEPVEKSCCGGTDGSQIYTLVGSYYSLKNGQETTLMFNNKGPEPLVVNPSFFTLSGERFDYPAFTIPGTSYQEVDLRVLLANNLPQLEEGSLQVSHQGIRLQLGAQFKILKQGMLFDEQFVTPATRFPSQRMESVWWMPSSQCDTKFIISNTTGTTVTATVEVDGTAPKQQQPATIQLNPHQTRVLDVLRDLVGQENGGTIHKEGGISITHSGVPGAILARMLVSRESKGYSSVINFTDPTTPVSSKLHGGGLRLGSIGNDELTPIVVARNVGSEPSIVRGRIPYTNDSGDVVFVTIPEVNIAAGKIKSLDVERAVRQANVPANVTFAGIELEYTTTPGSVIMTAQSVSQSGEQVFQVPLLDPQRMPSSAGGFPWKVDGDYTTVVFIKNETATPKKYLARLIYEGGSYALKPREVKPNQTIMLDFKQMRDEQSPDSMGNRIPLNVERGQIGWSMFGADNNTMSGRSEQVNTALGVSSTYACYNCCPDDVIEARLNPLSNQMLPGGQIQYGMRATVRNCYLNRTFFEFVGYNWSSSNLAVGEIDYSGLATAMNGGTASITGYFDEVRWENNTYYCSRQDNTISDTGEMLVAPRITSITPTKGSVGGQISVSIDGTGFTPTTTIVPITGITFSDIQRYGTTSIVATFTISENATAGNNQVKVKTGNQTSNGMDFFVQIPKSAERLEIQNTVIIDPGPGDIVDIFGQVFRTNRCGAYRNLKYQLVDQNGEVLELGQSEGLAISESFSNTQISPQGTTLPEAISTLTNNISQFADIIGATTPHPTCPPVFTYSATQNFTVIVNRKSFPLTTKNTLGISKNSSGQWTITVTNVTP